MPRDAQRRPAACARCSSLLGAWELYAALGGVDDLILPAPTQVATALWDDRGLLWDNFARHRAARSAARHRSLALVARRACSPSRCTSRATLRRAVYPLLVGSQAIPIVDHRAAARGLVRLRHPAQARDHRAGLLLPGRRHDARRPAPRRPRPAKLMRTLDASRWQAFRLVELPAALPAPAHRRQDRRRRRRDRRRASPSRPGSSDGPRPPVLQAIPQLETRARLRRRRRPVAPSPSLLFGAARAGRAPAAAVGPPTDEGPPDEAAVSCSPLLARRRSSPSPRCGEKKEHDVGAAEQAVADARARLLPQRRPRRASTRRMRDGRLRARPGSTSTLQAPSRPVRAAEAAGRRQGRPGDLLRARAAARARQGRASSSRSGRSCRSR